MKKQTKKLIAPIIITFIITCYFISYMFMGLSMSEIPSMLKIILLILSIVLIVLSVYMLFERIDEIKGGEEDDLSKY